MSIVPVWTIIVGAAVFFYVVLDGFDLGIGTLFVFTDSEDERRALMNSIAPVWDGNETWLVLGGLALMAAFPLAFSIILPAVYFPLLIMLLALIFRGVAFEFRFRDNRHPDRWDRGFCWGSAIAAFAQGIVLGSFFQGFRVQGRAFAGTALDCFTPFSLFTGLALVSGYMLLGATWLILKTDGTLNDKARKWSRHACLCTFAAMGVVSLWTPIADRDIALRWFSWPDIALLSPVPLITSLVGWLLWRSLERGQAAPFLLSVLLFCLSYLGISISLFPMIVSHHFTIWDAASDPATQIFLALGTLFLLPIIGVYTAWSYWVFRGKARSDFGYH